MLTIGNFLGGMWANEIGVDIGVGIQKKHGHLLVFLFMLLFCT